jgi:GNAT superfamily N-acetyltransferase
MNIEFSSAKNSKIIADFQVKMALETENIKLDREIVTKGVQAVFDDPAKGKYLVAISESEVVASLLIVPEWSDWRNGTVYWIHSVYVIPVFRGQKVFFKMYSFLKEMVSESESIKGLRLYVDKTNIKAQKVYEAIGMTKEHYELYEYLEN